MDSTMAQAPSGDALVPVGSLAKGLSGAMDSTMAQAPNGDALVPVGSLAKGLSGAMDSTMAQAPSDDVVPVGSLARGLSVPGGGVVRMGSPVGGVVQLRSALFDDGVRACALAIAREAFSHVMNEKRALALATSLLDGQSGLSQDVDLPQDIDLLDLWLLVCWSHGKGGSWSQLWTSSSPRSDPAMSARLVAAFVRLGLPLCAPFRPLRHPPRRRVLDHFLESPLSTAVQMADPLAHALLDLPTSCGLDVNVAARYSWSTPSAPEPGPSAALGRACSPDVPTELFGRLLNRSNRELLNAGRIYVHMGADQSANADVHILIRVILRCTYGLADTRHSLHKARLFIARAQPDGDGVDLTAGIAKCVESKYWTQHAPDPIFERESIDSTDTMFARESLWPEGKFRGVWQLVDTMHQLLLAAQSAIVAQAFAILRSDLSAALRRVRDYRQSIPIAIAHHLSSATVHARDLHNNILSYLLFPLQDESQLNHPTLDLTLPDLASILVSPLLSQCTGITAPASGF
jgi:hypothetical protein